jgi:hypothetical protein
MKVPAKRARLAPREFKLLDLDDDALIMIIGKLDHRSKLQMMLTCKRFEGLIGHTHQFYKNFKFRLDQQEFLKSKETRHLEKIRRRFAIAEISGGEYNFSHSNRHKSLKRPILEFLKKIGAQILKIKFNDSFFFKSDFCKLMKALPKVSELKIKDVEFSADPDQNFKDFELTHLKKLEISQSTGPGFLVTLVPASLKILRYNYLYDDERWDPEVLEKQEHLEELGLIGCEIHDFNFDPENCHVQKLEICCLEFSNASAFEKFSEFMKIQESVKELEFGIDEKSSNHNYAGILTHLFNLKTLKKVTIDCEFEQDTLTALSSLKVCNPSVDTLIILKPLSGADLKSISKFFPSVIYLKITWKYDEDDYVDSEFFIYFEMDLSPINSMKQIRKLEIDYMDVEMIAQLELSQLQELHVSRFSDFVVQAWNSIELRTVNLMWRTFTKNHSQLKILHIPKCYICVEQLQITLEYLRLLESLEVTVRGFNYGFLRYFPWFFDDEFLDRYKKERTEKAAHLIGDNYDRLEHLKLDFAYGGNHIKTVMTNYLKNYHPGVYLIK